MIHAIVTAMVAGYWLLVADKVGTQLRILNMAIAATSDPYTKGLVVLLRGLEHRAPEVAISCFHLYTGAAIAAFYLIYISTVPRVSSEVTV